MNDNNAPSPADEPIAELPADGGVPPELGQLPGGAGAPAAAPTREARKHLRANVTWRGAVRINNKPLSVKVVNASEGGLAIVTDLALPMGQSFPMAVLVPISVDLLRQEQVMFTGKVVHSVISGGMYRIGVQFASISDAHRGLIRDWVSLHGKAE